jgi:predicted acylesterase/phospholipase RssA
MFRSIAFGGGGMRGALHLGGLHALLKFQDKLEFPDGIYGYSVGSIVATAVAFNLKLEQIQQMIDESMNIESIVTHAKLSMFTDLFDKCGLLSMDKVGESITKAFLKQGVDLRGKVIADAPQKLFIGASNLTLRKPVFFTGQVPILTAMKASCCIPCFFQPQVVYNNVYLDGGVYMYYFDEYLPKDCLSFTVSYTPQSLRPQDIRGNLVELVKQLYCGQRRPPTAKYAIWFKEDKVHVIHDIKSDDKKRLIEQGYLQVFAFLSKRLAEEGHQV